MTAPQLFLSDSIALHAGDSREVLRGFASNSFDSVVTDPPYALVSIGDRYGAKGAAPTKHDAYARATAGFMGRQWDTGETAFSVAFWAEVFRVLKPGGYVVAFSGTRTYHRMVVAIEDAGFEVRDQLAWIYGSGFPKSLDLAKAIDKAAGARGDVVAIGAPVKRMIPGADQHVNGWEKTDGREYQPGAYLPATAAAQKWDGWGTALKPAWEPIVLARKPLIGTNVENVLAHGTGALNIDGCRVAFDGEADEAESKGKNRHADFGSGPRDNAVFGVDGRARGASGNYDPPGRFPANIVHDGSDEVVDAFPDLAARFFYSAKADADDRLGSGHPTVKPVDLMRWLVRLVTPKGGTVLEPFAGTGTTGEAAYREGCKAVLIEREAEYQADIARRMALVLAGPDERVRESVKAALARGKTFKAKAARAGQEALAL